MYMEVQSSITLRADVVEFDVMKPHHCGEIGAFFSRYFSMMDLTCHSKSLLTIGRIF